MRILITIIITVCGAIGLGIFLKDDPGRLVFTYAGTTVQTSFAFFLILLIVSFISLYYLFSFIGSLITLPKQFRRWSGNRRSRRSEKYLTKGFLALLEGNWHIAEEAFRKGAPYSRSPLVNYLGAARAAQRQGAVQRRDHYLRLAHEFNSNSSVAVGLTQAELQLSHQQTEQAYATLRRLDENRVGKDQIKLMLLEASSELKEWQEVLSLLSDFKRKNILPNEQIKAKQLEAYTGILRHAGTKSDSLAIEQEWNKIPRKLRDEISLIEVYVNERLKFPDTVDCELILQRTLKKNWDQSIVRLYGMVRGKDAVKQLAFAERLLVDHPRDPVLLLTLARFCNFNSLWGKAKSYLEASLDIEPSPEACQELAILLEQQGDQAAATIYYQKGLALVTNLHKEVKVKLLNAPIDEVMSGAGSI